MSNTMQWYPFSDTQSLVNIHIRLRFNAQLIWTNVMNTKINCRLKVHLEAFEIHSVKIYYKKEQISEYRFVAPNKEQKVQEFSLGVIIHVIRK